MNDPVILKKPAARIDLTGCYAYIGARNPDAARRFRLAAEATFAALACSPGIGAPYEVANPRLQGLRSAQVRRFRNYLIFYTSVRAGGVLSVGTPRFSTNLNILRSICSGHGDPARARQRRRLPTVHRGSTHAPRLQRPVASEDEASEYSELRLGCHPETPVIEPCQKSRHLPLGSATPTPSASAREVTRDTANPAPKMKRP